MNGMRIFLFAGTSEGRELAQWLAANGCRCTVSVATEYGSLVIPHQENLCVLQGRMSAAQMEQAILESDAACVVDATHPFASEVSREIRRACQETKHLYLRLRRNTQTEKKDAALQPVYVDTMQEAAVYLKETAGNILLTTGSKQLAAFLTAFGDRKRVYARVLPGMESLAICKDCGLEGRHVIAMQGPFSGELDIAMLHQVQAAWMVTKETGQAGGYEEKLQAAASCGVRTVVLRNPENSPVVPVDVTYSFPELLQKLTEMSGVDLMPSGRSIALAGIGPGAVCYRTQEVQEALREAQLICGAQPVLDLIEAQESTAVRLPYYQAEKILGYLETHPEIQRVAVAFSGDTGFYSGATTFLHDLHTQEHLSSQGNLPLPQVRVLCGIPAVICFAAKLGTTWQDMKLLSAHGRVCNVIGNLQHHERCFLLVSGLAQLRELAQQLQQAQENGVLQQVRVTVGYQLSTPQEEIRAGEIRLLQELEREGLYVLLLEHPAAKQMPVTPGLPDSAFLRASVPMTKEEIRALSLCKLQLTAGAVVADIGAGTGSVSIEAARLCVDGMVYAFEQKAAAAALIRQNAAHFCLSNLQVIEAKAPDGIDRIPVPTHAFIGGSSGNLREILEALLARNPSLRIVINTVTLETMAQVQEVLQTLPVTEPEWIQVAVTRAEKAGSYHLLRPLSPVCIISCTGQEDAEQKC